MKLFVNVLFVSGLLLAGAIFTGCQPLSPPSPKVGPKTPAPFDPTTSVARFRVGDTLEVTLTTGSDQGTAEIPPHIETIKEDGTITLDYIGSVTAAGKTPGQLQNEIHDLYVPKYYVRLTVTVKPPTDRVYYVGGQVNHAGVQVYLGDTTVTKAIHAAEDFNNFASHTVTLTRTTGERIQVNVDKVLAGKEVDPPVYPGDQIDVPRSIF